MTRFAGLFALVLGSVATGARAAAPEAPPVTVTQDGPDLVVALTVTANNSAHVLWTGAIDSGDTVTLRYYVIQNPDLFVRSQKQVRVTWRIPNRKAGEVKIGVREVFRPNSAELKALLPRLQQLADEGAALKKARAPHGP